MSESRKNRLQHEPSAYLSSAAHQPVDWFPWGPEAFEKASQEQKPILLDIGAVWCHWCHVMDRESYENEEIAALINRHFVAIKVDRDEKPDIDTRYQSAVSALTQQGGWPLTAFLTPGGKPFFGGTYFPPTDQMGRPGFKRILAGVAENFQKHREDIERSADSLTAALQKSEQLVGGGKGFDSQAAVNAVLRGAVAAFDERNGGFGHSPKFPHPAVLDLMMETCQVNGDTKVREVVVQTLTAMARGGIYDHLAGGFHRYSVDERWHVPHFEKMSYDNSELLRVYLHGFQLTGEPLYREAAAGIVDWVDRDLSDPERGGFFASQDADINLEDDGDHFTWALDEVRGCLTPEEAEVAIAHFNIRERGDMHHNPARNVLARRPEQGAEEGLLAAARAKMLAVRLQRPIPYIDKTVYVSWNALFISAYLEAARVLNRASCREQALRTLDRLLAIAWSPQWGFTHRCPGEEKISQEEWSGGVLDDQIYMLHALLDAFESTGKQAYFERAEQAAAICLQKFWDEEGGGFFDRPKDAPALVEGWELTKKPFQDSPTPGANSQAAMALDRLYAYTLQEDYRTKARRTLEAFAGAVEAYGYFAASYGQAALLHSRHPVKVVVVGAKEDERTRALTEAAHRDFRLGKAVLHFEPGAAGNGGLPAGLEMTVEHWGRGEPVAIVCGNTSCQPPVSGAEALLEILKSKAW